MSAPTDPWPPESLFERLRATCPEDWRRYIEHRFVAGLADGGLPESCFRDYLVQDYLFLIHFARAYGLAVYKGDTLAAMRRAAATLSAILEVEMELHIRYCEGWGLDPAAMAATPEATECMAYTRFVLERGLAGDILDLQVALAPCVIGYGEIGRRLAADPATVRQGNPYLDWIEMYASPDYQELAQGAVAELDRLWAVRGAAARFDDLARTFADATRLEAAFWEMGFRNTSAAGPNDR